MHFTQLRFYCSKQRGRTFHVITAANSTGEAVVQYFSGQTDVLPYSCNSFYRMEDDNSKLAAQCDKWGYDGSKFVGKWGHSSFKRQERLYLGPVRIPTLRFWYFSNAKWLCDEDDVPGLLPGGVWKIYVR